MVEPQDAEHQEQAGGVGQGVQAAGGDGGQPVEDFQIAAGADKGVRQGLVHQPQAAGGGAGDAGEHAGGEHAPDVGVHVQVEHPVHDILEGTGVLHHGAEGQHGRQAADTRDTAAQAVAQQGLPVLALKLGEIEHIGEDCAQQHGASGQHGGVGHEAAAHDDHQQQHHNGQECLPSGRQEAAVLDLKQGGIHVVGVGPHLPPGHSPVLSPGAVEQAQGEDGHGADNAEHRGGGHGGAQVLSGYYVGQLGGTGQCGHSVGGGAHDQAGHG